MARSLHDSIPPTNGLGGIRGFMVGLPGIQHSIHQLGGEKGRTVIRIFPEIENGAEKPWRLQEGDNYLSNWMRVEPAVAYCGLGDKFTCLTTVKGHEDDDHSSSYRGPIDVFIRTLRKQIKDSPKQFYEAGVDEWLKWPEFKGPLPAIDLHGFVQGMLFENKGKPFMAEDNRTPRPMWPVILMLKRSAYQGILNRCNKEVEGYRGSPEDYNARYLSGDPVGCQNGKPISFTLVVGQGQGQGGFGKYYEASFGDQALPLDPGVVTSVWKPWDQLLRHLTEEEQMNLLANHFPGEALDFVFRGTNFYEYLSPNTKGKWQQQLTKRQYHMPAPAPGQVPGQPYPPGTQYPPGYGPGQTAPPAAPAPGQAAPAPAAQGPGQAAPPGYPVAPAPAAPTPVAPVVPAMPSGYPGAPAQATPAAPVPVVPAMPGVDLSAYGPPPAATGEGVEESPHVANTPQAAPNAAVGAPAALQQPPTAAVAPFDGGTPYQAPPTENASQAPAPAAPAPAPVPSQPTGDPTASTSAAAAARARLKEATDRAASAQEPPKQ